MRYKLLKKLQMAQSDKYLSKAIKILQTMRICLMAAGLLVQNLLYYILHKELPNPVGRLFH